jgi:hypothetical protein
MTLRTDRFILNGKVPEACEDSMLWALWYATADRIVEKTDIGSFHVSTVFLGLNHRFGDGAPLVFETMVFRPATAAEKQRSLIKNLSKVEIEGDALQMRRYSTWDEAMAGHNEIVQELQRSNVIVQRLANAIENEVKKGEA